MDECFRMCVYVCARENREFFQQSIVYLKFNNILTVISFQKETKKKKKPL